MEAGAGAGSGGCGFDRGALLRFGEHRVDNDRMPGARDTRGFVDQYLINLIGDFGAISFGWQSLGFGDFIQRLALHIGTEHQRARGGWKHRGEGSRQMGFSRAR